MSTFIGRKCAIWIFLVGIALSFYQPASAADWKPGVPRTAYVNLFEWSWSSIARECVTELGPKGYAAVQVSPPQEHAQGSEWWRRYQPASYKIISRSGNRAEFALMVQICKAAGVDIYVDTVINHMAGGIGVGIAGSPFGNYTFPAVPYTRESFHTPACVIQQSDYDNVRSNVTQCDLPGLPDLDTGNVAVQKRIAAYMKDLLSLGVAGFRIDAAKHIKPEELAAIKAMVPGNYFLTQEVVKDGSLYSSGDINRYPEIGTVNEFSYIYAMKNMFLNLYGFHLSRMPEVFTDWGLFPSDKATVFVSNHDTERSFCDKFAPGALCDSMNVFDGEQYFLANVFMLGYPYGYPQVMSGYNFSDHDMGPPSSQPYKGFELSPSNCKGDPTAIGKWNCAHRDNRVDNMVGFRNYTSASPLLHWSSEGDNRIAFNRGNKGFVAINNTAEYWTKTFSIGLPDATYCNVVASNFPETGVCPESAKVNVINGQADLSITPNSAVALHFGATVTTASDLQLGFPDSLNVARSQIVTSKKTIYLGLKSIVVSVSNGDQVSVNGGAFSTAPATVRPGQTLTLKTTAPMTDHTVKLVKINFGSASVLWKVATSGSICTDAYCPSVTPLDYTPANIIGGKPVTLFYMGTLANSTALTLRWGNSGWNNVTDVAMSKRSDGFWSVTITPPANANAINFVVTDGTNWDNNDGSNWNLPVSPAVDTSVTITFKVTAETGLGENVYIVGNQPELGNWSTAPASFRQCAPTAYPQWTCTITFPVSGINIEYKYQKLGNGNVIWENGNNYTYTLPATNAEVDNGLFR